MDSSGKGWQHAEQMGSQNSSDSSCFYHLTCRSCVVCVTHSASRPTLVLRLDTRGGLRKSVYLPMYLPELWTPVRYLNLCTQTDCLLSVSLRRSVFLVPSSLVSAAGNFLGICCDGASFHAVFQDGESLAHGNRNRICDARYICGDRRRKGTSKTASCGRSRSRGDGGRGSSETRNDRGINSTRAM